MPLSDVVSIQISTTGGGLTQPGFGTAMILGAYGKGWAERTRFYTDLVGGVDQDFAAGTPEYLAAAALFSQNPRPEKIAIGRGTRVPTQAFKVYIPANPPNATKVALKIAGVEVSFTTDANATRAELAAGLHAAINAGTATHHLVSVKDAGDAFLTVTHDTAGGWTRVELLDVTPGVQVVTIEETTAEPGVADDLGEIALESGANWYAVVLTRKSKAIIDAAAAWVEANEKILAAQSIDTAIINTVLAGATDVAAGTKTAARVRTGILYSPDNGEFLDAAVLGRCLPLEAGSETWALKTLSGPAARTFTGTQLQNLKDKLCGWYYALWGRNLTMEGKVGSGEYFDAVRGRDALKVDMQGRILLRLAAADKVAFTDAGAGVIRGEIDASLKEFVRRGFLVDGSTWIKIPKVADVSPANKAARNLAGITFGAQQAGAIHRVAITGVLTN